MFSSHSFLPRHYRLTRVIGTNLYIPMNKFVLMFLTFSLYVCVNIYVCLPPTLMRSEPYVKHIQMENADILIIAFLWLCLTAFFLSNIDLNVRYIPFNTSLNT